MMILLYSLYAFFVLLFLGEHSAYAWGPATHLEYAGKALESIALFAPSVKKLVTQYRDHFLYGSVAADITLGKGVRGYMYNCHNWHVAFDLLNKETNKDFQKAFMLGYLGHLSVDTVAHNYFVPYKMIRSWKTRFFKHLYWEMRMDLSVPEKYWDMFQYFSKDLSDFAEDDELLEGHLKRTFFSFKTNKKIFNSLLAVQRMKNYKKMAHKLASKTIWKIEEKDIENYKKLALNSLINFLTNPEKSYVLEADPTGKQRMVYARKMIRDIRQANNNDLLTPKAEEKLLLDIKNSMEKGLYIPASLPTIDSYLG